MARFIIQSVPFVFYLLCQQKDWRPTRGAVGVEDCFGQQLGLF